MLTGSGSSNGSLSGDFDSGHVADGWHLQFLLDGNALEIRILTEGILDAKLYLNVKILDLSSFRGYCLENLFLRISLRQFFHLQSFPEWLTLQNLVGIQRFQVFFMNNYKILNLWKARTSCTNKPALESRILKNLFSFNTIKASMSLKHLTNHLN